MVFIWVQCRRDGERYRKAQHGLSCGQSNAWPNCDRVKVVGGGEGGGNLESGGGLSVYSGAQGGATGRQLELIDNGNVARHEKISRYLRVRGLAKVEFRLV